MGTGAALADWPIARHDGARTARSLRPLGMDRPAVRWRGRLGGTLGQGQIAVRDVDGDGQSDAILVAGGRLLVRRADDSVISESSLLELTAIIGADDYDEDGALDVVATSATGRAHVLDPATGGVQWATAPGFIGVVGAARIADLDADGAPDLYISDQDSGATGSIPDRAAAYRLGSPSPGEELWQMQAGVRDGFAGFYDLVAELDGDPTAEIVTVGQRHLYVFDGSSGGLEYASPDLGPIPNSAFLVAAEGPNGPLLAALSDNSMPADNNSRRVLVLRIVGGSLERVWERSVVDLVLDRHGFIGSSLGDLDGDDVPELATSFFDHSTAEWTLEVLSAVDGAPLASASADRLAAVGDLEGDGRAELITYSRETNTTTAWAYGASSLEALWSLPGFAPAMIPDPEQRLVGAPRSIALFVMWGGTTRAMVLRQVTEERTSALVAFDVANPIPVELGRYTGGADVSLLSWVLGANVTRPYEQVLVTRSDGYLAALSNQFKTTNFEALENVDRPGIRVGGYWSGTEAFGPAPIAARVAAAAEEDLFVRDSRGFLLRLRPAQATLTEPPSVLWALGARGLPSAVDIDGDQAPEIVVGDSEDVVVVDAETGTEHRRVLVAAAERFFYFDLLAADVDGEAGSEIGYQVYDPDTGAVEANFVRSDGLPVWESPFVQRVVGGGGGPMTWIPGTAGGVVSQLFDGLFLLDATAGSTVGRATVGYLSAGVVADDLDGVAGLELLLTGSAGEVRAFTADLKPLWVSPQPSVDRLMMGSVASCQDGPVLVQGHYRSPVIERRDAATGRLLTSLVLAGGEAFATVDEAVAAGAAPGFLSSVATAPNDLGDAGPVSVVGSTDGFIYLVGSCEGLLRHAVEIGYSVGEPILADVDGDDLDEIIATAADGYLYGIDQEVIPPPSRVFDTDGTFVAMTDADDLDEIETRDTLWANWSDVPGATSYEVAILTSADTYVTDPAFQDVGSITQAEIGGLGLMDGGRYHFAVRAVGPAGSSVEAFSDGVLVRHPLGAGGADAAIDAGGHDRVRGGGCSCRHTTRPQAVGMVVLSPLVVLALACRRRRR